MATVRLSAPLAVASVLLAGCAAEPAAPRSEGARPDPTPARRVAPWPPERRAARTLPPCTAVCRVGCPLTMPQRRDGRPGAVPHPTCAGTAIVEVVIDLDGSARQASALRPLAFCGEEAASEVRQWRWHPLEWDGEPVTETGERCSRLPGDAVAAQIAVTVRFAPAQFAPQRSSEPAS